MDVHILRTMVGMAETELEFADGSIEAKVPYRPEVVRKLKEARAFVIEPDCGTAAMRGSPCCNPSIVDTSGRPGQFTQDGYKIVMAGNVAV